MCAEHCGQKREATVYAVEGILKSSEKNKTKKKKKKNRAKEWYMKHQEG